MMRDGDGMRDTAKGQLKIRRPKKHGVNLMGLLTKAERAEFKRV